jgi:hypothetical protein
VDLLPDHLQVIRQLRVGVRLAEEVAELLGAVRLRHIEVVEVQAELLGELLELDVRVVDQLAAVLVDLPVGEVAAACPAAPAHPARRLVDLGVEACLLQPIGGGEPGETCSDDGDADRRGRGFRACPGRAGEVAEQRGAGKRCACALQKPTPRRASFLIGDLRHGLFNRVCERRTRHSIPSLGCEFLQPD